MTLQTELTNGGLAAAAAPAPAAAAPAAPAPAPRHRALQLVHHTSCANTENCSVFLETDYSCHCPTLIMDSAWHFTFSLYIKSLKNYFY